MALVLNLRQLNRYPKKLNTTSTPSAKIQVPFALPSADLTLNRSAELASVVSKFGKEKENFQTSYDAERF